MTKATRPSPESGESNGDDGRAHGRSFGEIVRGVNKVEAADAPEGALDFTLLETIAVRYGVTVDAILAEIQGDSILARMARDITGIPPREKKARGIKPDVDKNWRLFTFVEMRRKNGAKLEVAIREWLELTLPKKSTNRNAIDAATEAYKRARAKWGPLPPESWLNLLFSGPPEQNSSQ